MFNPQVFTHLRSGKPVRFDIESSDFTEGQELVDDLEKAVGLPLERREVIDRQGSAIVIWIRGLGSAPIVEKYKGVEHVRHA